MVLALAGAGLVLLAGTRSWASVSFDSGLPGLDGLDVPGRRASPGSIAVALAVLAAAVVLAVSGRIVRFLVGAGLVVAGVLLAVVAVRTAGDESRLAGLALKSALGLYRSGSGGGVDGVIGGDAVVATTAWGWVAAAGAVTIVAAGLITLARGGSWAGPARRYERTPSAQSAPSPWDALSRGEDPTSTGPDAT